MNKFASREFWSDAAERSISTAAQTAIGAIGTDLVLEAVDWKFVAGTTLLAAGLSLLKAIVKAAGTTTETTQINEEGNIS
ncbi:holin [Bifidobacterium sp.]|uniref:holin n=1 Tax=Bifidobacterium sp. TaxID=41200 RepID=UPI0039EA3A89